MSVKIVTDSTSYLPAHLRDKYDIKVISLGVSFGEEVFKEEEMENSEFYVKMDGGEEVPTSSPPSINEFLELFEDIIKDGHSVLGVFLSSDLSETYSRASIAKQILLEKYPKAVIEVMDSRTTCMQSSFMSLAAALALDEHLSMEELVKIAQTKLYKSRFLFSPEVLDYLKKGGRIGKAAALLGSIFQIRPILTVVDGKIDVLGKVRTKEKAVKKMLETFLEDVEGREIGNVVIHHINNEEEAIELAKIIEEKIEKQVDVHSIGPVIGLHVGPGTLGIVYSIE
ncbi:DegV family protein [Alkalicella caledoniensis]|uniref:DegV family protein n=1 Tax=Alkalicella caledoniensis TaxID=2731377 RepID=A0A7G9W6C0_ALKCA|nr:DegV family protein [Alkalicella caledoniensis]QNO14232.1 DegV family protein [Alkalicella caledoniensis]